MKKKMSSSCYNKHIYCRVVKLGQSCNFYSHTYTLHGTRVENEMRDKVRETETLDSETEIGRRKGINSGVFCLSESPSDSDVTIQLATLLVPHCQSRYLFSIRYQIRLPVFTAYVRDKKYDKTERFRIHRNSNSLTLRIFFCFFFIIL
jgi:hypothetical protein